MKRLYYGDNLDILRSEIQSGSVDLCYIDPPFNSKRNYNQIYNNIGKDDAAQSQAFIDTWNWNNHSESALLEIVTNTRGLSNERVVSLANGLKEILGKGSLLAYLLQMTVRILEIHRCLSNKGSFYLHCDPAASHYLKLVCDAIFVGSGGDFKNEIVWKRTFSKGGAKKYIAVHDVILFYTKSKEYVWNNTKIDYSEEYIAKNYNHKDDEGYFNPITLTGAGTTEGESGQPWKGINPTSVGRHWALPKDAIKELELEDRKYTIQEKLDLLDRKGLIYWPKKKNGTPRFKLYLEKAKGVDVNDVIIDIPPLSAKAKEKLNYPTQKPEALIERFIRSSSLENSLVLDAFCGCGTTVAVANRLNRNWIGIDITYQSIAVIVKRLEDTYGPEILQEISIGGTPKDIESATALANKQDDRTRKEFEKWAVLTYTDNRALINEKKGSDKGVDGVLFIYSDITLEKFDKVLFSVKSGKVGPAQVRDFIGTVESEEAKAGVFITLQEPTPAMYQAASAAGVYTNSISSKPNPKILIVTIREILEGSRLPYLSAYSVNVLKASDRLQEQANQNSLFE